MHALLLLGFLNSAWNVGKMAIFIVEEETNTTAGPGCASSYGGGAPSSPS
jgi:hypothetical protein